MNCIQLLIKSTDTNLLQQEIAPGHNGPYDDPETHVRNAGHWIITLGNLWRLTNDDKYLHAIESALELMLKPKYRPNGIIFHHRTKKGKDKSNGLIGQAWSIEALVTASELLNRPDLLELAEKIFTTHPFSKSAGLWERVDLDGSPLGFDTAFNHQLWFAAAGGLIISQGNTSAKNAVLTFLDKVPRNMSTYNNGLIYHIVNRSITPQFFLYKFLISHAKTLRYILPGSISGKYVNLQNSLEWKSVGYHSFNLFAFAMLKKAFPNHPVWNSTPFKKTITYLESSEYQTSINNEQTYGFAYNAPGFEVPFALSCFSNKDEDELIKTSAHWIQSQINKTFDKEAFRFSKNTNDPVTLNARIYEMSRWPAFLLKNVKVNVS